MLDISVMSQDGLIEFRYLGYLVVLMFLLIHKFTLPPRRSLASLNGPSSSHLILGNLPDFIGVGAGRKPLEWLAELGPTLRVQLGFSPALFTTDRLALSFVLKNADIFPKQPGLRRQLARYLDHGVVVAEGEVHQRQRRLLNTSFAPAKIRGLQGLFLEVSERVRDVLLKIKGDSQDGSKELDMLKWTMAWSMDIIGLAGFGHDMGGVREQPSLLAKTFEASVNDFSTITPAWVLQMLIPFFDYIPNPVTRRINRNKLATRKVARAIFEERKTEVLLNKHGADGEDILSSLVRASLATEVPGEEKCNDDEVVAQIGTMLLAGKANVAFSTTWCLYALAGHPSIQERLREELFSVHEEQPSSATLESLPILNAVIRESLRLHPSVPQTMRVATQDVIVPLETPAIGVDGEEISEIHLKTGTTVVIPILYANRSKEIWGSDAEEFNPDRFLDGTNPTGTAGRWGNILSFIDGPRSCIGYQFALAEMRALLFVLIRTFGFGLIPGVEVEQWIAIKNQPFIKGQTGNEPSMPMRITPLVK